MSELRGQEGSAGLAGQPAANDALTAGALLRRARVAMGLHVGALAVSLKVPVRKLEALEDDRWEELPDAVFVRALASSVCRTLKIDPQPVLDRLPQTAAPRLIHAGEGINTTFRAPGDGSAPIWLHQLTRPVFLVVFALLLGALALSLLPAMQPDEWVAAVLGSRQAASQAQPATVTETAVEPAAAIVSAANVPQPVAAQGMTPALLPGAASVNSVSTATPVEAAPASATVVSAGGAAAPATGIVVFRAKRPSWVEVTDANGVVAVRRLLAAGEAAGASGALPLQVIIGRADATEVQVRGKPFDLGKVSSGNVARFEVK